MSVAPTTAAAVANFFLNLEKLDKGNPPVDQMKLQKLLFYAHAWYLALFSKPLFEEDFEAWPWGPVVKSIYYQTARCGRNPVDVELTEFAGSADVGACRWVVPTVQNEEVIEFLKHIWNIHKPLSGIQLSNATHGDGEPWTIIKNAYGGNLDHKPIIPNEVIEAAFKAKIANG